MDAGTDGARAGGNFGTMKPLGIDLFCGLGGWAEGFLAEGWDVIGFDIERHVYGNQKYPAQLVLQDVLTLHGRQFKDVAAIVASPPCQAYSWMAMSWSLAKAKAAAYRANPETQERLNALFNACFRIQKQASEAAGRHIPMMVENVRGAELWVGEAQAHFGSFYLWGDVRQVGGRIVSMAPKFGEGLRAARRMGTKVPGNDTFRLTGQPCGKLTDPHYPSGGVKQHGSGEAWFDKALDERRKGATAVKNGGDWFGPGENMSLQRAQNSRSNARKAASAMIAKIPFDLARHIARCFKP